MEIISIPLSGSLRHEDSMGNMTVIQQGDVQIMSAGTGVIHAEFNNSETEDVKFLQIWIFPDTRDLPPRYDQKHFSPADEQNQWQCIVQPAGERGEGVTIHQRAWLHIGQWDAQQAFQYEKKEASNGVYAFVLEGEVVLAGQTLTHRDALGLTDLERLPFESSTDSRILLLEVPMQW
jgi:redox-sensitive bicupin YhaK (pirin superfamily)